ncbi:uncharacterized protein LOC126830352 [Patella vulgata]|uniref:uncharacterized protein LOC126830352 n=1 Tax=Patella vulgata TaxID=6465 RepID=UPI00217F698A|nr:uncharacterized protein LOC126830352 [Patella vulgata]XP_050416687.1 uncharacterized protein LOC126830352 [Patella vulgata]
MTRQSEMIVIALVAIFHHLPEVRTQLSNEGCPANITVSNVTDGRVFPVFEKHETAALILVGFGGFSVLLALLYNAIRKHVFKDVNSLDTTFDAGGKVSMSLTAVTVASQLMWPGDLLQCSTVASQYGVAGPFWYSVGAIFNMILFPVLSVHFKTRSPGAKTYLQIINARFGPCAHIIFCCFALLTNVIVMTCLIVGGKATIQSMTNEASDEFCIFLMATLFGCYSFVGGLGTTFYVSYFNAVLIFGCLVILTVKVFYTDNDTDSLVGGIDKVYESIYCMQGPEENEERSYLTFWSEGSLMWGILGIFATSSLTFCDQASWQSRIAAKPTQGVMGFLAATYMWFAIPTSIGTSSGLAYLALSSNNSAATLPMDDVHAGLVTPFIAEQVLGSTGGAMILTMLTMALMSTGSGEVMAVSSIIVYDIYQSHIKPFRRTRGPGQCILCGMQKASLVNGATSDGIKFCSCASASDCEVCKKDVEAKCTEGVDNQSNTCPTHGGYRTYQDNLIRFKSWCILWVTIGIVPLGMMVCSSGIDLNWMMLVGFIVTIPCFPGAVLSIIWVKTSTIGIIAGSLTGLFAGVSVLLGMASRHEGGLNNFMENTSKYFTVLSGSSTSFNCSLIVTVLVSLLTHKIKTPTDELIEWQKMRDIDNPLSPWMEKYREEFPSLKHGEQPTFSQLDAVFKTAKRTAYVGGAVSLVLFTILIPSIMTSLHVLSAMQFRIWVMTCQLWAIFMAVIVIVVVPIEELTIIFRERMRQKTGGSGTKLNGENTIEMPGYSQKCDQEPQML